MSKFASRAVEAVYNEFASEEISYIDAIEAIMKLDYSSLEAEAMVCEWEEDLKSEDVDALSRGRRCQKAL